MTPFNTAFFLRPNGTPVFVEDAGTQSPNEYLLHLSSNQTDEDAM